MTLDPDEVEVMGPGWGEHREHRRVRKERWKVRAAEWKILELAQLVFGEEASVRLARYPSRAAFRGLMNLHVPFLNLRDHRLREAVFLAYAGGEAVLEEVPLIYIFDPVPHSGPLPALDRIAGPDPRVLPLEIHPPRYGESEP